MALPTLSIRKLKIPVDQDFGTPAPRIKNKILGDDWNELAAPCKNSGLIKNDIHGDAWNRAPVWAKMQSSARTPV